MINYILELLKRGALSIGKLFEEKAGPVLICDQVNSLSFIICIFILKLQSSIDFDLSVDFVQSITLQFYFEHFFFFINLKFYNSRT